MELRQLRQFQVVAEELSFRRAAARLNMAQPPLSVQVRKLEEELGVELFTRDPGRGVHLTHAGHIFLIEVRKILAAATQSVTLARRAADGEVGHLSVGFTPAAEYAIFPTVVPAFRARWPDVHLSFRDLRTLEQLEALHRGELDIGFVWLPAPTHDFDVLEVMTDAFVACLPKHHPLAQEAVAPIAALSGVPLILFPPHLYPDNYRRIEELFVNAGARMNVVCELEASPSIVHFVAMGHGVSILPNYSRAIPVEGVVFRPLSGPSVPLSLVMIKRKGEQGLSESFFRFIEQALKTAVPKRRK